VGAYSILLAVDEQGVVQAHGLRSGRDAVGTPFERVKANLAGEERLVTTTLDPDLILPGSYLQLWAEGQPSRRVTDLIQAFGQFPRLPRLLRPDSLYDTLKRGVQEGVLVLRLPRVDGSARTWWRISPDMETLARPELEVVPAMSAELQELDPELLKPDVLAGLWSGPKVGLSLTRVEAYFDGQRAPRLANADVAASAVRTAVRRGLLMARIGMQTLYREELPAGPLALDLELMPPPEALAGADLLPSAIPEAWQGDMASLQDILDALVARRGYRMPWTMLSHAVDEAMNLNLLALAEASGPWPCSPVALDRVRLGIPENVELSQETLVHALQYTNSSTPTLRSIQDAIQERFFGGRPVPADTFITQAQAAITAGLLERVDPASGVDLLSARVRRPARVLFAEATFDDVALERLVERSGELYAIAPELVYTFRVSLTAEGQPPDEDTLTRLNALLASIREGWSLT
jgi:hypothetical protein